MTKYSVRRQDAFEVFNFDDWHEVLKCVEDLCKRNIPHVVVDNEFNTRCPMCDPRY